jgi:hypothetical protein
MIFASVLLFLAALATLRIRVREQYTEMPMPAVH